MKKTKKYNVSNANIGDFLKPLNKTVDDNEDELKLKENGLGIMEITSPAFDIYDEKIKKEQLKKFIDSKGGK